MAVSGARRHIALLSYGAFSALTLTLTVALAFLMTGSTYAHLHWLLSLNTAILTLAITYTMWPAQPIGKMRVAAAMAVIAGCAVQFLWPGQGGVADHRILLSAAIGVVGGLFLWHMTELPLVGFAAAAVGGGLSFWLLPRPEVSIDVAPTLAPTLEPEPVTPPEPCKYSYCVTPLQRVDLDGTNCTRHTKNYRLSVQNPHPSAAERLCARHGKECIECAGRCEVTSTSTCEAREFQQKRDSRETPVDAVWQLGDRELVESFRSTL